jgi:hypothetical protein
VGEAVKLHNSEAICNNCCKLSRNNSGQFRHLPIPKSIESIFSVAEAQYVVHEQLRETQREKHGAVYTKVTQMYEREIWSCGFAEVR